MFLLARVVFALSIAKSLGIQTDVSGIQTIEIKAQGITSDSKDPSTIEVKSSGNANDVSVPDYLPLEPSDGEAGIVKDRAVIDSETHEVVRNDAYEDQAKGEAQTKTQEATPTTLASSKVSTDSVCAMLMIVFLCLALLGLIWVQRSHFHTMSKTELVATIAVGGYMGLTIAVDILIRKFHQEGGDSYNLKPQVMTCLIEIGKLMVCGVLALVDWERTKTCSRTDFLQTMKLMAIPSVCYVWLNLGRWLALSGADLDTYRVWRCTDILFVACIWCGMFRKRLASNQVVGILLVFFACVTLHSQQGVVSAHMMWPVIVITSIAFVSSLGLVMNEFGMKASANLSIFVQCFALYIVTSGMNGIVVVATVPRAEIFGGIKWPQVLLIVLDVFLGLCVACVLKYANAMVKQLGSGWLAMLEPLVGHFFVGTPVTPVMVLATILAGAGSVVYRLEPASESSKKSSQ